jgi:hypothetical protein
MNLLEARAKIERANVHIGDVERRVNALEQTDTAIVEIHPEHGTERLTHTLDESGFDQIALVTGDAVHNLNCALDYTWLQTIQKLAPNNVNDRAKFPVHKTINELKGELRKGNVDTTCPHLFTFIVDEIQPCDIQPCDGGNPAIWPIHCFANRDKHRFLIPVLAEGHINGIEVQDETGKRSPGSGFTAPQKPPYCFDIRMGLHFTKKGKLTANVIVEDEKSGCRMDIPQTLVMYSGAIAGVVEAFESFLMSEGF